MDEDNRLPIDRGWAWMILIACTLESFLMIGNMKSFGIFFVEFLHYYEANSSEISVVVSVRTISISIVALFVLSIGSHYLSNRWFVLIGCGFGFASYIVCAFAPDVNVVMLSQGIFWGTSVGMAHGPTLVMVGKYFNKKRGLANSLANIGGGVGGLLLPPLIRVLLDFYGLRGTLIIFSGIMLNVAIVAALLRPLEFYSKRKPSGNAMKPEMGKLKEYGDISTQESLLKKHENSNRYENGELYSSSKYEAGSTKNGTLHLSYEMLSPLENGRLRTQSTNSAILRTSRLKTENGSSLSLNKYLTTLSKENLNFFRGSEEAIASLPDLQEVTDNDKSKDSKSCGSFALSIIHKIFNFKVLRNRQFNLLMITGFIAIMGNAFVVLYLPAHAKDMGINDTYAALLVSIVQATDIVSRICMAFILDRKILKRHQFLCIALMITGIACQLMPLFTEFWSLALYAVIYGFFGGLYFAIYPVLIVDFVGIEYMSSGMAIMMLLHGIALSAVAPMLGALRDTTGAYLVSYHVMGAGSIIGALLLLLEPLVARNQNGNVMTLIPNPKPEMKP